MHFYRAKDNDEIVPAYYKFQTQKVTITGDNTFDGNDVDVPEGAVAADLKSDSDFYMGEAISSDGYPTSKYPDLPVIGHNKIHFKGVNEQEIYIIWKLLVV